MKKNTKFIDPRYFMDEKMERADEGVVDTVKGWFSGEKTAADPATRPRRARRGSPDYVFVTDAEQRGYNDWVDHPSPEDLPAGFEPDNEKYVEGWADAQKRFADSYPMPDPAQNW